MYPSEMPWWKSKVIVGAAVSIISKILYASGAIGELSSADNQELVDLIVLLIGGIGDLVAIGSRVTQRAAPAITASVPKRARWSIMLCAMMLPLFLSGCALTGLPQSPASVSDTTKVDEQAALTVTLAYTAAAKAATLAIKTGLVSDPVVIAKIGALDNQAYAAVTAVDAAYQTGNAASYSAAIANARAAISAYLNFGKGE